MNAGANEATQALPAEVPRLKGLRRIKTLICVVFHRSQWYTRHTYDGGYYGEADTESCRCRACGRRWKRPREN